MSKPRAKKAASQSTPRKRPDLSEARTPKLNKSKINRAKKLLGTKTDEETIERALDLVLAEQQFNEVHRRLAKGGGKFKDPFK